MSRAMERLQEKIGSTPDGSFGPKTAQAIAKFYELTPERAAHLLGQAAHESGGFRKTKESLYYSTPERIRAVWPSRFKTIEEAAPYAKNPAALAGKVYLRKSLGNLTEADAKAHIGRGMIQLTGKSNYRQFASDMALPEVLQDPSLLETEYAFETALWFFKRNDLFKIADGGINDATIKKITKRVNGGYHGLKDRITKTKKIFSYLKN